MYALLKEIRE